LDERTISAKRNESPVGFQVNEREAVSGLLDFLENNKTLTKM